MRKTSSDVTEQGRHNSRAPEHEADPTAHILLKVRSEGGLTISAHRAMLARRGVALFGKMGKHLSLAFENTLNRQIERGIKTYLFLTTREGWKAPYVTERCELMKVCRTLAEAERAFIPGYYAGDSGLVGTWFEISSMERLTQEKMDQIFVLSSGRPIASAVRSMTTIYRVGLRTKTR